MVSDSVVRSVLAGVFLLISACGGGNTPKEESPADNELPVDVQSPVVVGEIIPLDQQRIIPTEEAKPFVADSRYASALAGCASAPFTDPCTLATLPYIGQENLSPTIDDVMERVLVTHDWMGVRLRDMLAQMPADLLPMFAPVTVIVIGSEVRPSSFSVSQGRVRIDPRLLWLSVDEKRTVATNDDPRSNFGSDLQFTSLTRFARGDNSAWSYWSLTDDSERTTDDIELALASLLYHELAHANDYVQPDKLATLSRELTPRGAFELLEPTRVSRELYADTSLTGQLSSLYGLAGVRYFDDEPTDYQKSLLADFVGADMGNQGKLIFYSYSTTREDVAMLIEGTMMKLHYDVDVHIGFANKPDVTDASCNDYKVAWGQKNRLEAGLVLPRARFVASRIVPHASVDRVLSGNNGSAEPLRVGDGWCDALTDSADAEKRTTAAAANHEFSQHRIHGIDPVFAQ